MIFVAVMSVIVDRGCRDPQPEVLMEHSKLKQAGAGSGNLLKFVHPPIHGYSCY